MVGPFILVLGRPVKRSLKPSSKHCVSSCQGMAVSFVWAGKQNVRRAWSTWGACLLSRALWPKFQNPSIHAPFDCIPIAGVICIFVSRSQQNGCKGMWYSTTYTVANCVSIFCLLSSWDHSIYIYICVCVCIMYYNLYLYIYMCV